MNNKQTKQIKYADNKQTDNEYADNKHADHQQIKHTDHQHADHQQIKHTEKQQIKHTENQQAENQLEERIKDFMAAKVPESDLLDKKMEEAYHEIRNMKAAKKRKLPAAAKCAAACFGILCEKSCLSGTDSVNRAYFQRIRRKNIQSGRL